MANTYRGKREMKKHNIDKSLRELEAKGLIVWNKENDTISLTPTGKIIADSLEDDINE